MRECQAIDNDFLPACTRDQNRLLPFQLLGVVLSQPLLERFTAIQLAGSSLKFSTGQILGVLSS